MIGAGILALALATTATAQVCYKLYFVGGKRPAVLAAALALFAIAQVVFFISLTRLDVGVVYMSTGFIQVLVLALSKFVLRERVTRDHVFAVALIAGGLILYAG